MIERRPARRQRTTDSIVSLVVGAASGHPSGQEASVGHREIIATDLDPFLSQQ